MLLRRDAGQRLEPVGVMGRAMLHCPVLHRLCHNVRCRVVQLTAMLHDAFDFCERFFGKTLLHLSRVNTFSPNSFSTFSTSLIRPSPFRQLYEVNLPFLRSQKASATAPASDGARSPFFPLIVLDLQHLTCHISAVRLHDLDHIAHAEFITLFDPCTALFRSVS